MKSILIVGEIFWDQYEDGSKFLGGSGLNIAWHLQALGFPPIFLGRIGNDKLGEEFRNVAERWGMDLSFVQIDPIQSTGTVKVIMCGEKKATYVTPPEVSQDYIEYESNFDSLPKDTIIYHGTCIIRNDKTRSTVARLKSRGHPIFLDLNLRAPFWSHELLDVWMTDVKYLKLSLEESTMVLQSGDIGLNEHIQFLQDLMIKKNIENIFLTVGEGGSYWIQPRRIEYAAAKKIDPLDTVGAGDAFVAGILYSYSLGLDLKRSNELAVQFGTEVCLIKSAISHDKNFYTKCRKEIWNL